MWIVSRCLVFPWAGLFKMNVIGTLWRCWRVSICFFPLTKRFNRERCLEISKMYVRIWILITTRTWVSIASENSRDSRPSEASKRDFGVRQTWIFVSAFHFLWLLNVIDSSYNLGRLSRELQFLTYYVFLSNPLRLSRCTGDKLESLVSQFFPTHGLL